MVSELDACRQGNPGAHILAGPGDGNPKARHHSDILSMYWLREAHASDLCAPASGVGVPAGFAHRAGTLLQKATQPQTALVHVASKTWFRSAQRGEQQQSGVQQPRWLPEVLQPRAVLIVRSSIKVSQCCYRRSETSSRRLPIQQPRRLPGVLQLCAVLRGIDEVRQQARRHIQLLVPGVHLQVQCQHSCLVMNAGTTWD